MFGRDAQERSGEPELKARQRSRRRSLRTRFAAWRRDEDGVSAVEFALIAPILFFGLVATADIGVALYQRMTIDHVLRAAAQSAMVDPGKDAVLKVLEMTAANNFALASQTNDPDAIALSVDRYCACPGDTSLPVDCSTTCSGSVATYIYYRLLAEKNYAGMILPQINFSPSVQVQVR